MNLLDILADQNRKTPLAERLRPKTLADYVGQAGVVGEGTPLKALAEKKELTSLLFWGPPGVGKTTLARLLAENSGAAFSELSAVNSGIKELRQVVDEAEHSLKTSGRQTVLFIDEIHRYSKTQQDALLPHVEKGTVVLIGSTTENPSFQVIPALQSRMLTIRLGFLSPEDIHTLLHRGLKHLQGATLDTEAESYIVRYANGDGRSSLNLLETAYLCAPSVADGTNPITVELLEKLAQQGRVNYDRDGDEHYDHASAFQKSLRGSDPDAALYWLAKMIAGGEDPRFIARRLVVTAAEDVGNAAPLALVLANAAAEAVERIGLPEGRIPLAQAVIYVAKAPKSNAAITAIDAALSDITKNGHNYPVPMHLRDSHYAGAKDYGHGKGYVYSHSNPDKPQNFLPDALIGKKYLPDVPQEFPKPKE